LKRTCLPMAFLASPLQHYHEPCVWTSNQFRNGNATTVYLQANWIVFALLVATEVGSRKSARRMRLAKDEERINYEN